MMKLSAAIITYNEERNIARCIESVKEIADEILVVDSHSTDNTVAIAESLGARVIKQAFLGYAAQRTFADNAAKNEWILMLDADEYLSPQLASGIAGIKASAAAPAYKFARLNRYNGKWIRHGTWYPDRKTRLYNRTKGTWQGGNVHEYWLPTDKAVQVPVIKGDLFHDSFKSIADHVGKINKYTDLAAHDAVARGKTSSLVKVCLSPFWTFFTAYIIRLGFLDGYEGYLIARLSAYMTFLKYSKIRQYSRSEGQ
ncbi:MAG: glycosyltransferase family 2 protein [Flavipsychrobacter sp.]|nr:glycosyltransferase family 2 protein [Flavipsychrobacter sp.]